MLGTAKTGRSALDERILTLPTKVFLWTREAGTCIDYRVETMVNTKRLPFELELQCLKRHPPTQNLSF